MRHIDQKGVVVSHLSHFQSKTYQNETQTPFCESKLEIYPKIQYPIINGRKGLKELKGSRPYRPEQM